MICIAPEIGICAKISWICFIVSSYTVGPIPLSELAKVKSAHRSKICAFLCLSKLVLLRKVHALELIKQRDVS